ncbi:MAG: hypothetical protein MRZ79_16750 [Bacteroidia bacterium]|nr:hypothetical protein [Bacteroidia bacterium]
MKNIFQIFACLLAMAMTVYACTMQESQEVAQTASTSNLDPLQSVTQAGTEGYKLNTDNPFSFVSSSNELEGLPELAPEIFAMEEVATGLSIIASHEAAIASGNHNMEGPTKLIAVNFYGYVFGMELPLSYISTLPGNVDFREIYCQCNKLQQIQQCQKLRLPDFPSTYVCYKGSCPKCEMKERKEDPTQ